MATIYLLTCAYPKALYPLTYTFSEKDNEKMKIADIIDCMHSPIFSFFFAVFRCYLIFESARG